MVVKAGFWWMEDLKGDEWNDLTIEDGLLNCLKAEETANGLLTMNDMIATMLELDGQREEKEKRRS